MRIAVVMLAALLELAAQSATRTVTWTNPNQNTDGTIIPLTGDGSLVRTTVQYGSCTAAKDGIANKVGEIFVVPPIHRLMVSLVVVQEFCIQAFASNTYATTYAPCLPSSGPMYAQITNGSWWRWDAGSGWSATAAPSATGASTLTPVQAQAGGSLATVAGTWTFGTATNASGNAVLLNGNGTEGFGTLLEVLPSANCPAGNSPLSNVAVTDVKELKVSVPTVYTLNTTDGAVTYLEVGSVPVGTPCDDSSMAKPFGFQQMLFHVPESKVTFLPDMTAIVTVAVCSED